MLSAMKESGNTASDGGNNRLRNLLLALQVAFTMILLVGGGLFGRSVMRAWSVDLGFRHRGFADGGLQSLRPWGLIPSHGFGAHRGT